MKSHSVQFEAVEVRTENGVCFGMAKTKQGEVHVLDGRTPDSPGMCTNALCALSNSAYIMMSTDEKLTPKDGYIDRVCPHGAVTFRLSRVEGGKDKDFNTK